MTSWLQGPAGEHLRAADERIRRAMAEVEALGVDVRQRLSAEGSRREEAARRGDLGEDWRRIQERIDIGRTTLADVFGGVDESAEAARLRGRVTAGLAEARQDAVDDPEGPTAEIRAELEDARARMAALLARAAGAAPGPRPPAQEPPR